jgi:hypothetical protein
MSAPRRHRRLGLIVPWALFAIAALGWTVYWNILRIRTMEAAQAFVDRQRTAGASLIYSSVAASGYPLRLTLTFSGPAYEAPGGGWALSAPSLDLHVNPSDLRLIILETHGAVTWRDREVVRTLTPRTAALSVRTEKGAFERAILEVHDVSIAREGHAPAILESAVIGVRPDPRRAADMQVSLDAAHLALAAAPAEFSGLGANIASIEARVVIENAAAAERASAHRLEAWRAAGGAARFEGLGLEWGPAKITGTGRLGLDALRRPQGRLDLAIEDPQAALNALAQPMAPHMREAFEASGEAAAAKGGPLALPLIAQDGVLSLGPLPLRKLDPVE